MTEAPTVGTPATIGAFTAWMQSAGLPQSGMHMYADSAPPPALTLPPLTSELLSIGSLTSYSSYHLKAPVLRETFADMHARAITAYLFSRMSGFPKPEVVGENMGRVAKTPGPSLEVEYAHFISALYLSACKAPGPAAHTISSHLFLAARAAEYTGQPNSPLRRALYLDAALRLGIREAGIDIQYALATSWLNAADCIDAAGDENLRLDGSDRSPPKETPKRLAVEDTFSRAIYHARQSETDASWLSALAYLRLAVIAHLYGSLHDKDRTRLMALAALHTLRTRQRDFRQGHADILRQLGDFATDDGYTLPESLSRELRMLATKKTD